mmetsp:Transcript_92770/g.294351  ORF Transcript_92770/g.294351 Transcript_92770/m.294351 type:complete len:292 (-) Transcript_92770:226-1101(-)
MSRTDCPRPRAGEPLRGARGGAHRLRRIRAAGQRLASSSPAAPRLLGGAATLLAASVRAAAASERLPEGADMAGAEGSRLGPGTGRRRPCTRGASGRRTLLLRHLPPAISLRRSRSRGGCPRGPGGLWWIALGQRGQGAGVGAADARHGGLRAATAAAEGRALQAGAWRVRVTVRSRGRRGHGRELPAPRRRRRPQRRGRGAQRELRARRRRGGPVRRPGVPAGGSCGGGPALCERLRGRRRGDAGALLGARAGPGAGRVPPRSPARRPLRIHGTCGCARGYVAAARAGCV